MFHSISEKHAQTKRNGTEHNTGILDQNAITKHNKAVTKMIIRTETTNNTPQNTGGDAQQSQNNSCSIVSRRSSTISNNICSRRRNNSNVTSNTNKINEASSMRNRNGI